RYKAKLVQELRSLKVLEMARPRELDTLYVHMRVRPDDSRRYVTDEAIEALSVGHPETLLRATEERALARQADAFGPEEAVRRHHRMLVLGDPGAGKTTMLKHLALRSAQPGPDAPILFPVLVGLRAFVDSGTDNILTFAAAQCEQKYGFAGAAAYLPDRLDDGSALLLFDGLDEVPDVEAYERAAREINRVSVRHPEVAIAVTCRRAGFTGGLDQFHVLEVLDFTGEQIDLFLGNWFSGREADRRDIRHSLSRNARMKTMAANPLILSLIAMVYESDLELPEKRTELYRRCVDVLLREWDAHRGIRRSARFTADRKRELLEELAWHFHRSGRRYFPEREVLDMAGRFLSTIDMDPSRAAEILDEIVSNDGLLKVQAQGWYGFWHLTLQEYFAAVWAGKNLSGALDVVRARRHDPWWDEVVLLLAGQLSDATPLLLTVLGHDETAATPPDPVAKDDDVLRRDLVLAGRCLLSSPRIQLAGLREAICAALWEALLKARFPWTVLEAARVLAALHDATVRGKLRSLIVGETGVANYISEPAAARALGEYADEEHAAALLAEMLREPGLTAAKTSLLHALCLRGAAPSAELAYAALQNFWGLPPGLRKESLEHVEEVLHALSERGDERVVPETLRVVDYLLGLRDERVEIERAEVGAMCAAILAKSGDTRHFRVVARLAALPYALVGSRALLGSLIELAPPDSAAEILELSMKCRLRWHHELQPVVQQHWSVDFERASMSLMPAMAEPHQTWRLFDFLEMSPVTESYVASALRITGLSRETTIALQALAALRGAGGRKKQLAQSFDAWLTEKEPSISDIGMDRVAKCLVRIGHERQVQEAVLRRIAERPGADALRLLSTTDVNAVADALWRELERLLPLLSGDARWEVLRLVACRELAGRIVRVSFPGPAPGRSRAALAAIDRVARFVDRPDIPAFCDFCARAYDGDDQTAWDALGQILVRTNARLFADGRVAPAA
ncbi:MAG: NACHT domain-containing protein, partial [Actinoplanes sp.]